MCAVSGAKMNTIEKSAVEENLPVQQTFEIARREILCPCHKISLYLGELTLLKDSVFAKRATPPHRLKTNTSNLNLCRMVVVRELCC